MKTLLVLLTLAFPFFAVAADEHETACRARLKQINAAIQASRFMNDGKEPASLSKLYLSGLVDNLGDFVCPASDAKIVTAGEIDANTDFTREPIDGVKDMIIREKVARHGTEQVLAAFADGSIKFVSAPGSSPRAASTGAAASTGSSSLPPPPVGGPIGSQGTPPLVSVADPPEFFRGVELIQTGRAKEGIALLDVALQKAPAHRQARFERASAKLWLNDVQGARADWAALAAANPDDVESRRLRAGLDLVLGDLTGGLAEAEALVKLLPDSARMWVLLGQAQNWNNNTAGAQQSFARAVQLDPNTPTGIYGQAGQFLAAGVPLMAYLQFNTVLAIDPNQAGAYHGFGFAASQLGMKDRAIDALQRYLRFDSTSAYAQSARDELARLSR